MTGLVADDLQVCDGFGSETPSIEDSVCFRIAILISEPLETFESL